MKNIVLTIVLLFSAFASAQNEENDWKKNNLYGKVKSVRETPYKAVEENGEIKKGNVHSFPIYNHLLIFNEKGFLTEEHRFNEDGSLESKFVYQYDEKGRKIIQNHDNMKDELDADWSYQYDENGKLTTEICQLKHKDTERKWSYKYDKKGNLLEETTHTNSICESIWVYIYDEKGCCLETSAYDGNKNLGTKITYKCNEKGYQVEETKHIHGQFQHHLKAKYDEKGNRIEEDWYDVNGNFLCKKVFKYNEKGKRTTQNLYHSDKSLNDEIYSVYDDKNNKTETYRKNALLRIDGKTTFQYQFDSHDNWIKKIEYKDSKPKKITERQIEYF